MLLCYKQLLCNIKHSSAAGDCGVGVVGEGEGEGGGSEGDIEQV